MTRAVIFGYGEIGVRCLAAVLARGWTVPLVVTHEDDPNETAWFQSLAKYAHERDLPVISAEITTPARLAACVDVSRPDFIFSFYYRRMLPWDLLALANRGALNIHGSLLPKFRGRAPINWAILKGEVETGATLHYMTAKPDAGAIVAQRAVPILHDDTALDVFRKVCGVAESMLYDVLPQLESGTIAGVPQNLAAGSYYGARRPEDGVIDWSQPAQCIHDLVRAVAPPYPGARTRIDGRPARILRTLRAPRIVNEFDQPTAFAHSDRCYASCGDGQALRLLDIEIDGESVDPARLAMRLAQRPIRLPLPTP
ncbi:MAG TPA: formyltransferase [Steroidobacteraceae bacterium]|jgi:methionyl-tRNA formyltransferase